MPRRRNQKIYNIFSINPSYTSFANISYITGFSERVKNILKKNNFETVTKLAKF